MCVFLLGRSVAWRHLKRLCNRLIWLVFTGKLRYRNTSGQHKTCNLFYNIAAKLKYMYISYQINIYIWEVKHHVSCKWQTRICTTWPSFLLTFRLLFIVSAPKLVVSRNFLSIRIFLSCFFNLLISILRNLQLESDVCLLPNTWSLNSLMS